jgi:hypothetical protein
MNKVEQQKKWDRRTVPLSQQECQGINEQSGTAEKVGQKNRPLVPLAPFYGKIACWGKITEKVVPFGPVFTLIWASCRSAIS